MSDDTEERLREALRRIIEIADGTGHGLYSNIAREALGEGICPRHIRPVPIKDNEGRLVSTFIAVAVECEGSGKPMREGKFCNATDCGRDMTYKLKG